MGNSGSRGGLLQVSWKPGALHSSPHGPSLQSRRKDQGTFLAGWALGCQAAGQGKMQNT